MLYVLYSVFNHTIDIYNKETNIYNNDRRGIFTNDVSISDLQNK